MNEVLSFGMVLDDSEMILYIPSLDNGTLFSCDFLSERPNIEINSNNNISIPNQCIPVNLTNIIHHSELNQISYSSQRYFITSNSFQIQFESDFKSFNCFIF